ncbi:MAG: hypothetical protein LH477_00475 [Nocardioides sp.]|nr:hypothetical protein [Nocardioides sp.]
MGATQAELTRGAAADAGVFVCLLGGFRVFKSGVPLLVPAGGKVEQVLGYLAMHPRNGLSREELIERVWPASDVALAGQSLNTLSHWLKCQLSDALSGDAPIIRRSGRCSLNTDASLKVDFLEFDAAVDLAAKQTIAGDDEGAVRSYGAALSLYAGDLWVGSDVRQLLERERLRAAYLTCRARLGDHYFEASRYDLSIHEAYELLTVDPFREDAHRMAMRCYVRSGQRAQAMRHYQTCAELLRAEFDAVTEPATDALYDQIRLNPGAV